MKVSDFGFSIIIKENQTLSGTVSLDPPLPPAVVLCGGEPFTAAMEVGALEHRSHTFSVIHLAFLCIYGGISTNLSWSQTPRAYQYYFDSKVLVLHSAKL